ncbi:TPA: hypothetical protein ACGO4Y_001592 [Streptococcus suis]
MGTYQSELFDLCKKIAKTELAHNISSMWDNFKTEDPDLSSKSMWFTSTNDIQNHFYGVLLIQSDNSEKSGIFSSVPKLDDRELVICKQANEFLMNLSNALVNELDFLPKNIQRALIPYSKLRDIRKDFYDKISIKYEEVIDFSKLIREFRKTYMYNLIKLKTIEIDTNIFNALQTTNVLEVFSIFERSEIECRYDEIPESLWRIKNNELSGKMTNSDVVEFFFFSLYVLRDIIEITLNTLYSALNDEKLPILSNKNLISVKGPSTNYLYKKYEFTKISGDADDNYPRVSNLCLINAQPTKEKESEIQSMVYIVSMHHQLFGKMGSTTSYKGLEVDESLNRFYNFFEK